MKSEFDDRSNYRPAKCVNYEDLYPQSLEEKIELIRRLSNMALEYEVLIRLQRQVHPSALEDIQSRKAFLELSIRSVL